MKTLKEIIQRQLDKIEILPDVRYLKAKLQSKMDRRDERSSIRRTYIKLFKLLTCEIFKIQCKFLKSNQRGSLSLCFTDNNSQIVFSNPLEIYRNTVKNINLNLTPLEIDERFNNYYSGNSVFPTSKERELVRKVIRDRDLEWRTIIICDDRNVPKEFFCRFTPSTVVGIVIAPALSL